MKIKHRFNSRVRRPLIKQLQKVGLAMPCTVGYMCKTDFDYELGNATGGSGVYSSVADLVKVRPCVEDCGIVEVKVKLKRVIRQSTH